MIPTLTELHYIVKEINSIMYLQSGGVEYWNAQLRSDGNDSSIVFLGIQIWSADIDERIYNEETDSFEYLSAYVRRTINAEIQKLSLIKL